MSHKSFDQNTYFDLPGFGRVGERFVKVQDGGDQDPPSLRPYDDHAYTLLLRENREVPIEWADSSTPSQVNNGTVSNIFSTPNFPEPWGSNDDLKLLGKLSSKINRFSFNAGNAIAEHKETLSLITDRAERLAKAADYVLNASTRRAALALKARYPRKPLKKDFASAWLELQYGWLPLVQDIYGGAEALSDHFYGGKTSSYAFKSALTRRTGPIPATLNGIQFTKCEKIVTKRITCKFYEEGLTEADRLGLLNPAYIAWEQLPYSFLADWVTPIGTFLEVAGVLDYLRDATFVKSTKTETFVAGATSGSRYIVLDGEGFISHQLDYVRTLGYTAGVPLPQRRPLNEIFEWQHCANALALLVQKFTHIRT